MRPRLPVHRLRVCVCVHVCVCACVRQGSRKHYQSQWHHSFLQQGQCEYRSPPGSFPSKGRCKGSFCKVAWVVAESVWGTCEKWWFCCLSPPVLTVPWLLLLPLPQVPAELYSCPQFNPVLPSVPPDLHPAREGGGRAPEQLLHHEPDGCAAANARQQRWGVLHPGDSHRGGCRKAPLLPKPRWECKSLPGSVTAWLGSASGTWGLYVQTELCLEKVELKEVFPALRLFCLLTFSDPIYLSKKIHLHCVYWAQVVGFPRRASL